MVDRVCVFPGPAEPKSTASSVQAGGAPRGSSETPTPTPKPDAASGSPAGPSPAVIPTPDLAHLLGHPENDINRPAPSLLDGMVNMGHMKLLLHFSLALAVPELEETFRERNTELTLRTGVESPYLMHEVLALSARHMSILEPENASEYLDHAVQLQTRAISLFNTQKVHINESTCVSLVLFSSILGRHLCIDALAFRGPDLEAFLDCYVNFARIRRGVRTIVSRAWPLLKNSELCSLVSWGLGLSRLRSVGQDCNGILDLLAASSSLPPGSKETCIAAMEMLQIAIDDTSTRVYFGRKHQIQIIFSWSLLVSEDFTEMLAERSPEAIAVLAHYAAVLHMARDLWQIGDSGTYLLNAICQYLGADWEDWLAWPRSVVFPEASDHLMLIDPALNTHQR
ncbi:C6 finger domain-containing protein [Colletotrichum tofieldiae]|uniref:C6 finger domain-containing protein n=1 Tax=Colletotrichum tofieldiae TaxID=708197 RepID=A0A166S1I7_9PEZI|nr:C6 finger domain-containing protein [Colletotrichum tofieldiae]GKT60619.1 C6 finger domain-containing protein [Colletotrichum tofieldiae]GKT90666.1 C6 finger domain-containing protein [Colletotrichum tofieldiae]